MNKLNIEKRTRIVTMLCEGSSIDSTCSMSGASKNTVLKLLAEVGEACALYQDRVMVGLTCKKIQCDQIWSFVGVKEKNIPEEGGDVFGFGDAYTWTSIDVDSKLMPCWHIGSRGAASAQIFMADLASRVASRIRLTTDGHRMYINAVEDSFRGDIDYATLVKEYGNESAPVEASRYHSQAECTDAEKRRAHSDPDMNHVLSGYIKCANLTMGMNMHRLNCPRNAFSKKRENHMHAISLFHMHHNFCRIHKSLRVTPAMEAGIADHAWDVEEVLTMVETARKNVMTKHTSN